MQMVRELFKNCLAGGAVLGCATAAMHYTGMAAYRLSVAGLQGGHSGIDVEPGDAEGVDRAGGDGCHGRVRPGQFALVDFSKFGKSRGYKDKTQERGDRKENWQEVLFYPHVHLPVHTESFSTWAALDVEAGFLN